MHLFAMNVFMVVSVRGTVAMNSTPAKLEPYSGLPAALRKADSCSNSVISCPAQP